MKFAAREERDAADLGAHAVAHERGCDECVTGGKGWTVRDGMGGGGGGGAGWVGVGGGGGCWGGMSDLCVMRVAVWEGWEWVCA